MTNFRLTTVSALFISAAICLQPRVAPAEISSSDLSIIEQRLFDINDVLANGVNQRGIQVNLYDNFVHFFQPLYSDVGYDLKNPRRLENSHGLLRFLWEGIKTGWAVTNFLLSGDTTLLPSKSEGAYTFSFYNWADPGGYGTDSFPEFLSLTLGSLFDMEALDELESDDPTNAWDHAFEFDRFIYDGYPASIAYTAWEAEAWRRQLGWSSNSVDLLRMNVSNSAAWTDTNTRDESNVWNDVVISSTNSVGQGASPPVYYHNPTNAVSWFGNDGDASVKALLPSLDWEIEGQANEVRLFGFDELDKRFSGVLAVDFTSSPWTDMRGIMQFVIAVSTCVVLVMIVRSEVNFWTTLGGSST